MKIVDWRGIRGLVAAELLTDTDDGVTYGEPFAVAGVSTLSKSTETSSANKYYDNVPAIVIQATGGDEVSIEASAIPEDVLAKLMGEYYDEATGMYVEGEPVQKYFAIGYVTGKTDGTEMYVWRLKGQFSYPEVEHATKDDGTDSSGNTITYTGVNTQHKFAKTGKTAKAINVAADKYKDGKGEAEFFETVQTPDTVGAAS
jgi:phi13 family phage major tail protein